MQRIRLEIRAAAGRLSKVLRNVFQRLGEYFVQHSL